MSLDRHFVDQNSIIKHQTCDALFLENQSIIDQKVEHSAKLTLKLGEKNLYLHAPTGQLEQSDLVIEVLSPCVSTAEPKLSINQAHNHLVLRTWDCEFSFGTSSLALINITGQILSHASQKDVENIYLYGGKMLSRVPAIAVALLSQQMGGGFNQEVIEKILKLIPSALPNRLMLSIADEALGRGGRLMAASFQHPMLGARYRERDDHMERSCQKCEHATKLA